MAGKPSSDAFPTAELRIIGGDLRGRKITYHGDPQTRPMKHRVREALFNLVGPSVEGTHAVDLFAGTGAVGLEALSRGATTATFVERHFPSAKMLRQNISTLGVEDQSHVATSDTFFWARDLPGCLLQNEPTPQPWSVYCCPPYDLYVEQQAAVCQLISECLKFSPPGSVMVVEADRRFDFELLGDPQTWDVRTYAPAVIGTKWIESPA